MSTELEFIELHKGGQHSHSVIWLHGLGANGHDFEPIAQEMRFADHHGIHFVFPHAPIMPITVNGGIPLPAWYDIRGFDLKDREDQPGIERSHQQIQQLIDMEHAKGISHERIFLAGFSQGGAMSLYSGLTCSHQLAGIIALSCYLPVLDHFKHARSDAAQNTPILQIHGTFDPVVQEAWGRQSYEALTLLDYDVQYQTYPIAHHVFPDEINLINDWINQKLV